MVTLVNSWKAIKKLETKKRENSKRVKAFFENIATLFYISASDAFLQLKKSRQDGRMIMNLSSIKGPQIRFRAGPDQQSIQLEKRRLARRRILNDAEMIEALEQTSDSSLSEDEPIEEFVLPTTPRQSSVSIEIPFRTLLKDTLMVTDRCQITRPFVPRVLRLSTGDTKSC